LGTPAAGNIPGGRVSVSSWTDSNGNLWLFGGNGYDVNGISGNLNDLWEFNLSTKEWAWMGGSNTADQSGVDGDQSGVYGAKGTPAAGNIPEACEGASSWIDKNGKVWTFGGSSFDLNGNIGNLNVLWEFNPSTNEWTWMGGSSTINQAGTYGTLGTPASENIPGGRATASTWTDSTGNLWLFGGWGDDVNENYGWLNDLWEFNPSTNEWIWMGGSSKR
jgi:N-acetylneuraminic acid mutarotase